MDYEMVHNAALSVLDKRGRDFVYAKQRSNGCIAECHYLPTQGPNFPGDVRHTTGCFVGEILTSLGLEVPKIYLGNRFDHEMAEGAFPDIFTDKSIVFLGMLQSIQDNGKSWGEALDSAEHFMKGFPPEPEN